MAVVFQTTFFNHILRNVVRGRTHNAILCLPSSWYTRQYAEVCGIFPRDMHDSTSRARGHWYISTSPFVVSTTVLLDQVGRIFVIRVWFFIVQYSCDFLAKLGNLHLQRRYFPIVRIALVSWVRQDFLWYYFVANFLLPIRDIRTKVTT